MKRLGFFFGTAIVLFSFQNCSQSLSTTPTASQASGINAVSESAKDVDKVYFWDATNSHSLAADRKSRVMTSYQDNNSTPGSQYCLTQAEFDELNLLLNSSEICIPKIDPTRVCTMEYRKLPYAILMKGTEQFRLGEVSNGCGKAVDLCGDKAASLKNFSAAILKSLDSRLTSNGTCP